MAVDCDHRHHWRADGGHAGGAASAENSGCGAADGRGLHHQRHPPADRPDDGAPCDRPQRRDHKGKHGGGAEDSTDAHGAPRGEGC